jgi:hypothetical protein
MPSRLPAAAQQIYTWLLKAYPPAFQARFAGEMTQVYRTQCLEADRTRGPAGVLRLLVAAVWDWGWAVIAQWWAQRTNRKGGSMSEDSLTIRDEIRPLSAGQAAIAALPFLLFGLSSLASKLPFFNTYPPNLPLWLLFFVHPYPAFNGLVLTGLGLGILRGFPRWTYVYLGWALLFAAWWSDMWIYGQSFGGLIWLPLLGVVLVALLIRRSWEPLRALFRGLWADWTLPSLGAYILFGFVYMLADENHHPLLALFISATSLGAGLGTWFYFKSVSPLRRILALVAGLFAGALLSTVNNATWDYRSYYGLPAGGSEISYTGMLLIAGLVALMLINALLARWRLKRNGRPRKL